MTTVIADLPELASGQATPEATVNDAFRKLEGRTLRVLSRTTSAQPGSPADGDAYILPGGTLTGTDWSAASAGQIALRTGGAWDFWTPTAGIAVVVTDEDGVQVYYDGADWHETDARPRLEPISVAGATTLTAAQMGSIVRCGTGGGPYTVTLPATADAEGRQVLIQKVDSDANAITVATAGSETIDGAASVSLASQWDKAMLVADGNDGWIRVA